MKDRLNHKRVKVLAEIEMSHSAGGGEHSKDAVISQEHSRVLKTHETSEEDGL